MIVSVPWKEKDGDEGEARLRGEVNIIDKEDRERMKAKKENVPVPRRVHIRKEDIEHFWYTVRCPGRTSLLKRSNEAGAQRGMQAEAGGRAQGYGEECSSEAKVG